MEIYGFLTLFRFVSSGTGKKQLQMGVGEHRAGKGIPGQKGVSLKDGGSCRGLLTKRQMVQCEMGGGHSSNTPGLLTSSQPLLGVRKVISIGLPASR